MGFFVNIAYFYAKLQQTKRFKRSKVETINQRDAQQCVGCLHYKKNISLIKFSTDFSKNTKNPQMSHSDTAII
jgi:phage protein U